MTKPRLTLSPRKFLSSSRRCTGPRETESLFSLTGCMSRILINDLWVLNPMAKGLPCSSKPLRTNYMAGCEGLQPSEFASPAFLLSNASYSRIGVGLGIEQVKQSVWVSYGQFRFCPVWVRGQFHAYQTMSAVSVISISPKKT